MSATFVPSRTTDLADIDPTPPANAQVLVWISSTSKWTPGSGGGNVTSVFGRTGVVMAQAGDYGVAQVTGAAPLASPAFTGTPTAPTASVGTNTTQVATTAFVLANGGAVSSVFGRTGAVVAQAGDYTAAQVGAQASSATLTALAAASYPTGRILFGKGDGVPDTDSRFTWSSANQTLGIQNTFSSWFSGTRTTGPNVIELKNYAGGLQSCVDAELQLRLNEPDTNARMKIGYSDVQSGYAGIWFGEGSCTLTNYSFLGSRADGGFPGYKATYFNSSDLNGVMYFRQANVNVGLIRNGIWTFTNSYAAPYLSNVAVSVISFGTTSTPIGVQAASGQTSPLTSWHDSTGTALGWIRPDASLKLPTLADTAASNDSAYYSSTQSTLVYRDSSGVAWPLTNVDTAPADLYVATTGSDTTGSGASGSPYATVSKALSRLPDVLQADHTIHVADGTYAAGIDLRRFVSRGDRTLTIAGNTTTPANVVFTGTITAPDTTTTGLYVAGPVRVLVQGITANVTATYGVFVDRNAVLTLDRCTITAPSSNAISDTAVNITNRSSVEFRGNITLSNWALNGIGAYTYSLVTYTVAGTLTITRPDSFGVGIHLAYHAAMICQTSSTNISISGAKIGWQLGLHGEFQHIGGSSTLSASNGSTPSSSSGILCTDLSTWSTNQPLSLTHFTTGRESNSISYIEATGGITLSSVTTASSATQNSVNNP